MNQEKKKKNISTTGISSSVLYAPGRITTSLKKCKWAKSIWSSQGFRACNCPFILQSTLSFDLVLKKLKKKINSNLKLGNPKSLPKVPTPTAIFLESRDFAKV